MKRDIKLFRHVCIALVLFGLLTILQSLLVHFFDASVRFKTVVYSIVLTVYGLYMIFIVMFCLTDSYRRWLLHGDWLACLLKGYGGLFLFCWLFPFLIPGLDAGRSIDPFITMEEWPRQFAMQSIQSYTLGLGLALPVSSYGLFLSLKALLTAKQKDQTYVYGILLMLFSLILLWRSYTALKLVWGIFSNG